MLNIVKDTDFDPSCPPEKGGSFQLENKECQANPVLKALSETTETTEAKSAVQVVCWFPLWES